MTELRIHPVCSVMPPMSDEDLSALESDVRANGVRVPIITYRGYIIDGRHRYQIARKLGVDCPQHELTLPAGQSLVEYAVALNLRRRHLTASQRAAVAVEILPLLEREAAHRRKAGSAAAEEEPTSPKLAIGQTCPLVKTGGSGRSRDQAARAVGVSPRLVQSAKRVAESAPQAVAKIKSGELSVSAAESGLRGHPPGDAGWFAGICNRLHALKREIVETSRTSIGRGIREQTVEVEIGNVVRHIRGAEPSGDCPYCRADESGLIAGCKACKGTGWLTRAEMDAVPKELRP